MTTQDTHKTHKTHTEMTDFFGDLISTYISTYTQDQAIEDGIFADLNELLPDLTLEHWGGTKVVCTRALWELVEKAVNNKRSGNETSGVFNDIFWMGQGIKRRKVGATIFFKVTITGAGRKRLHTLKCTSGIDASDRPTLIFLLQEED